MALRDVILKAGLTDLAQNVDIGRLRGDGLFRGSGIIVIEPMAVRSLPSEARGDTGETLSVQRQATAPARPACEHD